jgi:hypothetical protein
MLIPKTRQNIFSKGGHIAAFDFHNYFICSELQEMIEPQRKTPALHIFF